MSFGFSPGDIVLCTKFIYKVVDALKDEGGSQAEYRSAVMQCQDVLSLLNQVSQLNLSQISKALGSSIQERIDGIDSIVTDFQAMIASFEKSMGKSSKRNAIASAPRKVQWAFEAAEDLSKFQPRLSAQLQLLQIVLQMSVLWVLLTMSRILR